MKRRDFLAYSGFCSLAAFGKNSPLNPGQPVIDVSGKQTLHNTNDLINVAFAISEGTTDIDWVGPQAVFQCWHKDPNSPNGFSKRFKLYTVSESTEPVGGKIPNYSFQNVPQPHIVVIPAQTGSPALQEWLISMHKSAEVIMSVCTGARHLAKTGLLDNKSATTHHRSIEEFKKDFPRINWVKNTRWVQEDKLYTGGGLTAGIDLALHIVVKYFGMERATEVAEHLEYDGKRWMQKK